MIVTWSETYLRTSLTNAFNAIRSSPPNVSSYLIEPTPVIERHVRIPPPLPPTATQLSSINNRPDQTRETMRSTTVSSDASWKDNLPDVCINLFL